MQLRIEKLPGYNKPEEAMIPHFLFPASPLNPRMIDEEFQDQAIYLKQAGFGTSVLNLEARKVQPAVPEGATIVHRGWMMKQHEYAFLSGAMMGLGLTSLTSIEQYMTAHWLPNWYPLIARWTPESRVLTAEKLEPLEALCVEINSFGFANVFIKDFVKSIKTGTRPFFPCPVKPADLQPVLDNMVKYRGEIEGGLVVREVEEFYQNSEKRYFVIDGKPYAEEGLFDTRALDLLVTVARIIPSPFYSVDIAQRVDGRARIIEIGDGQVSDLVGWTPERFAAIWKEATK